MFVKADDGRRIAVDDVRGYTPGTVSEGLRVHHKNGNERLYPDPHGRMLAQLDALIVSPPNDEVGEGLKLLERHLKCDGYVLRFPRGQDAWALLHIARDTRARVAVAVGGTLEELCRDIARVCKGGERTPPS